MGDVMNASKEIRNQLCKYMYDRLLELKIPDGGQSDCEWCSSRPVDNSVSRKYSLQLLRALVSFKDCRRKIEFSTTNCNF